MGFPFSPKAIGAGIAGGVQAASVVRGLFDAPEFPITEGDLNKQFDRTIAQTMAQIASGTRRRLTGAGLEGSGAINSAILDQQRRAREGIESQRQTALQQLRQARFNRDVQAFNNVQNILGSIGSIGVSIASGALGGVPNVDGGGFGPTATQASPAFQSFLRQPISPLAPRPTAATGGFQQGLLDPVQVPTLNLGF